MVKPESNFTLSTLRVPPYQLAPGTVSPPSEGSCNSQPPWEVEVWALVSFLTGAWLRPRQRVKARTLVPQALSPEMSPSAPGVLGSSLVWI